MSETPNTRVVALLDRRITSARDDKLNTDVIIVSREEYLDAVNAFFEDGYTMCIDVTAVDYLHANRNANMRTCVGVEAALQQPHLQSQERFELITNLLSHEKKRRVRLRVLIPADDPVVPSIVPFYPGAEFMEREVFDLMGLLFSGHPDLTRILMPDDWEGHPLRKDYDEGRIPVQFKYTSPETTYNTERIPHGGAAQ